MKRNTQICNSTCPFIRPSRRLCDCCTIIENLWMENLFNDDEDGENKGYEIEMDEVPETCPRYMEYVVMTGQEQE